MALETSRRSFLTGLGAMLVAAPAIVRAGSLMPVRAMDFDFDWRMPPGTYLASPADITAVVRRAFVPRLYVQLWSVTDLVRGLQIAAGA